MGLPITADNWIPKDKDGNIRFAKVSLEQTWHAMEELQKMGLVKSIGVSNYSIVNMLDLFSYCKVCCHKFEALFVFIRIFLDTSCC